MSSSSALRSSIGLNTQNLRNMRKCLAVIALCIGTVLPVSAQFDYRFWMPPIWNSSQDSHNAPSELFITTPYPYDVNVHIETPDGTTFVYDGVVSSGSPLSIPLTPTLGQTIVANAVIENNGFIVTSTAPIQCVHKISAQYNQTLVTLKGRNGRGTDFWCGSQVRNLNANYSPNEYHFITVMAMEDNTTINFTTPFGMFTSAPGDLPTSFSINLNRHQCYLIRGNDPIQHVAGAHVTSNKKIVVISGSTHTRISGTGANAADGATDQLVPIELAGTQFAMITGDNDPGFDYGIIVATENSTSIYLDGNATPAATINAGQYYDWTLTGALGTPHTVTTNKTAYLYHVSGTSQDDEVDMSAMPQLDCTGSRYIEFSKFTVNTAQQTLQLIVTPEAAPTLKVNGTPYLSIPGVISNNIPGLSGWKSVSITTASLANNNVIQSDGFFHAGWLTGNSGSTGAYGFLSGFDDAFDFLDPTSSLPTSIYQVGTVCQGDFIDHCVQVVSCGIDHEIVEATGGLGTIDIAPPTSPYDSCFRYTAPDGFVGYDTLLLSVENNFDFLGELEVVFLVVDPQTPIDAGPNQTLCGVNTTTLSAVNPDPYANGFWTVLQGGATITNPNSPTTTVTNLALGTNSFLWHQEYPCDENIDLVQVFQYTGTPPIANAGPDAQLCGGATYTMQANSPGTTALGIWEITCGQATIGNINNNNVVVTNLGLGINCFEWNIDNGPCSGGNSMDQMTILVYNPNHPAANAGVDQFHCFSPGLVVNLNTSDPQIPAVGTWTLVSGTGTILNSLDPTTTVTGLSVGQNIFQWTINNGPCGNLTDQIIIWVHNPNAPIASAGPDQTVCLPANSAVLAANTPTAPATGAWTILNGTGSFANVSSPSTTVSGLSLGTNTFRWTINNGPCANPISADDIVVNVFPASQPTISAGADLSLCNSGGLLDAVLTGSAVTAPGSGLWTVVNGTGTLANANAPSTTVSGMSPGINTYQWTVSNGGCTAPQSDQVVITVYTQAQAQANAGPNVSMCTPTTSYIMQATAVAAPAIGVWTLQSGSGAITSINSPTTQITNLGVGVNVFRWTIDNGSCGNSNFDEVVITVHSSNAVSANAAADQEFCMAGTDPVSAFMNANSPTAPSIGTWSVVAGSGTFVDPNNTLTQVNNMGVGANVFQWTINNGACGNTTDQVTYYVFSPAQTSASAGADQQLCSNANSTTLTANGVIFPATGVWTLVSGTATILSPNTSTTEVTGLGVGTNVFQWTIDNGPCSTPLSLIDQVSVTVFNSAQSAANAGPDQTICNTTSSITMAANSAIFPGTGSWSVISGTGSFANGSSPVTSVSGLSVGINVFQWSIANGPCGNSSDQVSITVYSSSNAAANAGVDSEQCLPDNTVQLSGSAVVFPSSGNWSLISGSGTITTPFNPVTEVTGLGIGENVFQWTVTNGPCGPTTTDQITITVFDNTQDGANAGPDVSFCIPVSSYVMQANTIAFPASGVWSVIAGTGSFSNINNPNATVSGLGIGTNTFRWTVLNGPCPEGTNFDDISIFIFDGNQPTANAGADQELCFGGISPVSTTLTGSTVTSPGNGLWTLVQGGGTIVSPTSSTTTINNLPSGINIFQWTVSNGPCANPTSSDQVTIFVFANSQSAANAGPDQQICSSNPSAILDANELTTPSTGQWFVISGAGTFANATNPNTTVSGLAVGTNVLQWTVDNGTCANPAQLSDQVIITVFNVAQAIANAGSDIFICSDLPQTNLNGSAVLPPASGLWTLQSGSGTIVSPTSSTSLITGLAVGANVFRWTVVNGPCASPGFDEVTVFVYDDSQALANAGSDQAICLPQNSVTLMGFAVVFPASGNWTLVSGSGTLTAPFNPTTTVTGLGIGDNVFEWTVTNGPCGPFTTDQVIITVFDNTQDGANAGPDVSFCTPTSSYQMQANTIDFPATGEWSVVAGSGSFSNINNPNATVTGLGVGVNTFRWTVLNGPCPNGTNFDDISIFIFDAYQTVANAGADQELCFNGINPVNTTLNGSVVTVPGTGLWTLVQGGGTIVSPTSATTSVVSLSPGINIFQWTVSNGPCANPSTSDQVIINVFTNGQSAANAGPDQELCSSNPSTTLDANELIVPATGQWVVISGSGVFANANNPNTTISGLAIGTNVLQWTVDNGPCANPSQLSDQVIITVYNVAQAIANAGTDISICSDNPQVNLNGSPVLAPANGFWTLQSGSGIIVSPTNPNTLVTGLGMGANVFRWNIDNGPCASPGFDEVTVFVFDENLPTANAGIDQSLCLPQTSTTLIGSILTFPATGQWTLVSGTGNIVSSTNATTSVTGLSVGQNVFRWTVTNGPCAPSITFDEINIFVYSNLQAAANAGPDQSFCEPVSSTLLSANSVIFPATGVWTVIDGSGVVNNPLDPNSFVTGLTVGENIFRWTVSNGPCANSLTTNDVTIFIYESTQVNANAGPDQSVCSPQSSVVMQGSAVTFPAFGTWQLLSGTGVPEEPSNPNSVITGLSVGENIFRWAVNNGPCANGITTDLVSIFVYQTNAPSSDAGPDQEICTPQSTTTMNGNEPIFPALGTWTLISGSGVVVNPNDPQSLIENLGVGDNIFQWSIDNGGCAPNITTDLVTIFVFSADALDANAGPDQDICNVGDPVQLAASLPTFPGYGEWTIISGDGAFQDINDPNTIIENVPVGINVFQWTVFNGPCANAITSDQLTVTLYDTGQLSAVAGPDQELCSPISSTSMSSDPAVFPGIGTWQLISGAGNIDDVNDPFTTITNLQIGVNVFSWTVDYATCGAQTDLVEIIIYNSAQGESNAGVDQEFCSPTSSAVLAASPVLAPGFGTWSVLGGQASVQALNNPNSPVQNLTLGNNLFVWTVYNGECLDEVLSTDTVNVVIYNQNQAPAYAGEDQFLCEPATSTVLDANPVSYPATGHWVVLFGNPTISNINDPNAVITNLQVGITSMQWVVDNGPCSPLTNDKVDIFVFDLQNPIANTGPDQSFCSNVTTSVLDGSELVYPAQGLWTVLSGTVTVNNPTNPNSGVSNLTVGEHLLQWTVNNGPCEPVTTATMSIYIFDANALVANAGEDQELCIPFTSTTFEGSISVYPGSGTWTLIQGSGNIDNPSSPQSLVTNLDQGENIFVWTVFNGPCPNSITTDTMSILMYDPIPAPAYAGEDQHICEPISSTFFEGFEPDEPGIGTWTLVSGSGVVAEPNNPDSEVNGLQVGENIFRWTLYNGPCTAEELADEVSIFIYDQVQLPANAGADQAMCAPQTSTSLAANSVIFPATGEWTLIQGSGTIVDSSNPSTSVINLGIGNNLFVWTIENGVCDPAMTTDTLNIAVFDQLAPVANAGSDQEFCLPTTSAILVGSAITGAMTGEWSVIEGTGVFVNDNASTTSVTGFTQGTNVFTWTVFNGSCSTSVDTSSIYIFNPGAAIAYAGEDVSICSPQSTFVMQAQVPDVPGVGTWALISGSGSIDDVNNPNATISGLIVGANTFSWTVYNGPCELPTTDEITIFVFDQNAQQASAGDDVELCLPLDVYQMQGNEPIYPAIGTWTILQGFASFADEHDFNTTIGNIAVGENIFKWTIDNGVCVNGVSSDQVSIFLFDDDAPPANAGLDQSWCTPVSSTIMGAIVPADPGFGAWELISGCGTIADVNDPNSAITDLCLGENVFSWTVYNGNCANSNSVDFVSIFIFDSAQENADAGPDQQFCTPQITSFMSANAIIFPGTGTWSIVEGSATIVDANDPSTDLLNLAVGHNVFVWTVFNGPCSSSLTTDTVVIDIFDQFALDANAGPDQEYCLPQTNSTMNGSALSGEMTGEWNAISGTGIFANLNSPNSAVSGLSQGINVFTWTVYNGPCGTSIDTTQILLFSNDAPVAFAGDDVSFCSDLSTYVLQATVPETPGTGNWEIIDGSGSLNSFTNPNAQISGLVVGETILTWTVYDGPCEPSTVDTISIFIYDEFAPDAAAGPDVEMCLPENSYSMLANSPIYPAFGAWTIIQGSATIDDVNSSSSEITNIAQGENIFLWTIDNGVCPYGITQDTMSIFVFTVDAEIAFAGEDQSWCEPVSSTFFEALIPDEPGYGTWQLISGCGNVVNPNDPNSEVTNLCVGENIFSWTVYNGPCANTNTLDFVSIFLFENTQDEADAGEDQQLCTPITSTQLDANSITFPAIGTWSVVQGSVTISDLNDPDALVTNAALGVNILVWTINNGSCENALSTDTMTISVFNDDLPEANAGIDQEFCLPQTSTILNGSDLTGAATGTWTLWQGGGDIISPTSDVTDVINLPMGENIFVWSIDNGTCGSSADTMSVFVFNLSAAIADAGSDASFCTPVNSYTLQANTPDTPGVGIWTTIPAGVIHPDSLNFPNATATGLTVGETIFIWTIYNGPCEPATFDVMSVFIFDQFAPNADAGPDQEICLPQANAFMDASEVVFPAVGHWTLIEGTGNIVDVNSPTSEMINLGLGTNCFLWTIDNGPCPNEITSDTVCIHVFEENIVLPNAGPDQDICTPMSSVAMSANIPDAPGSAYWTLISGSGFIEEEDNPTTEITGLAVGINVFTWTFYNGPCSNALPADTIMINVFDQSQPAANAGVDQEICLPQNVVFMNGNVPTTPATGEWTLVQGSGTIENASDPQSQISDLGQGVNCFVWTINNGPCQDAITSDTVYVLVFDDQAPLANAGEDIEICTPEDCVILNADEPLIPGYGTWSVVTGSAAIDDLNDPSAQACNLTVGLTQLVWTVDNGPCANSGSTDTLNIYVFDGTLEGADAGDDVELCSPDDTYVLQGNTPTFPATGLWTIIGPGTIDDPSNPNATVSGLEAGETTLFWSINNGPCGQPSVDEMKIIIYDPTSPDADAGNDQALCDDFPTITLDGNTPTAPAIGTWTLISGSGDIVNPNDPSTTVENVGYLNNVFVWTIYNGVCPNGFTSDTVTVFVNSPTISATDAGADTSFCGTPGELTLNGSVTLLSGTSLWTILQGGGDITDVTNNNPQISNIPIGINEYLYTVDNGVCGVTSDTVQIVVFDPELASADAGLSITICEHDFTSTNLSGNEVDFPATSTWSILEGPGEILDPDNPNALVTNLGEIIVPLEDVPTIFVYTINNGVCGSSSDSVMWILQDCLTIEIPDAFSPNGDGTNDTFVIPNLDEYPKNRLDIFNRWGAKIYEAAPYQNDWDGRSEHPATIGEELPVSTYYYVLDLGTGEEAFHGFIYLKR